MKIDTTRIAKYYFFCEIVCDFGKSAYLCSHRRVINMFYNIIYEHILALSVIMTNGCRIRGTHPRDDCQERNNTFN